VWARSAATGRARLAVASLLAASVVGRVPPAQPGAAFSRDPSKLVLRSSPGTSNPRALRGMVAAHKSERRYINQPCRCGLRLRRY
jgi:hypothetical protein